MIAVTTSSTVGTSWEGPDLAVRPHASFDVTGRVACVHPRWPETSSATSSAVQRGEEPRRGGVVTAEISAVPKNSVERVFVVLPV